MPIVWAASHIRHPPYLRDLEEGSCFFCLLPSHPAGAQAMRSRLTFRLFIRSHTRRAAKYCDQGVWLGIAVRDRDINFRSPLASCSSE